MPCFVIVYLLLMEVCNHRDRFFLKPKQKMSIQSLSAQCSSFSHNDKIMAPRQISLFFFNAIIFSGKIYCIRVIYCTSLSNTSKNVKKTWFHTLFFVMIHNTFSSPLFPTFFKSSLPNLHILWDSWNKWTSNTQNQLPKIDPLVQMSW